MKQNLRSASGLLHGVLMSVASLDLGPLRRSLMLFRLHTAFGLVEVDAAQDE